MLRGDAQLCCKSGGAVVESENVYVTTQISRHEAEPITKEFVEADGAYSALPLNHQL